MSRHPKESSESAASTPARKHSESQVKEAMKAFHQRLQDDGLKSTRQRDVIVELFFSLDKHITADELLEEVRQVQPRIGYATVYRTLKLLVDQDLALPKDFGDGQTRYDPIYDQDPSHDHIICVDCRKIVEFSDEVINQRIAELAEKLHFSVHRKKLELYAECHNPDCKREDKD